MLNVSQIFIKVMLTAEAEVEGQKVDDLLTELVRSVEVPRI